MIKFFRKIRQQLLNENKFSKYLLYAIGEIVLVVIGILIALQINNWNENKKSSEFEYEMFTQILENLKQDKQTLKKIKANFNRAIRSSNKILETSPFEYKSDSLKFWLADIIQFQRFQPITNSYEALKSKGLDKVSDKELRFLLGAYYDDEVNHVVKSVGDVESSFNNDWVPILKEVILDFKFQDYVVVSDPTIFDRPTTARNNLIMNKDNYRGGMKRISTTIQTVEKLEGILTNTLKK
jgi:hypothetical protein